LPGLGGVGSCPTCSGAHVDSHVYFYADADTHAYTSFHAHPVLADDCSDGDRDGHGHRHADRHAHRYRHSNHYGDAHRHRNRHGHADRHTHSHRAADGNAYGHCVADGNAYGDSNRDGNVHSDGDDRSNSYSDAYVYADTYGHLDGNRHTNDRLYGDADGDFHDDYNFHRVLIEERRLRKLFHWLASLPHRQRISCGFLAVIILAVSMLYCLGWASVGLRQRLEQDGWLSTQGPVPPLALDTPTSQVTITPSGTPVKPVKLTPTLAPPGR
jgi:hypothetical protein